MKDTIQVSERKEDSDAGETGEDTYLLQDTVGLETETSWGNGKLAPELRPVSQWAVAVQR